MRSTYVVVFLSLFWHCCIAPPVSKTQEEVPDMELIMHYHHYLKEVIGALEKDPEFKKKLETAEEADIKSGKIANELEFVSHHVRNQLDEFKRQELMRLRSLNKQQHQISENQITSDPNHGHLDRSNPHTFEVEDLKKLISKTMENLEEQDRKRREQFKEYEMQKQYEKFEKLNHTNGEEKEKLEKEYKEKEEKHKKHEPLHEPGHKAQLEEVWHEQDQMQQEFDPKTFFMMHDLDSNGLWDQQEVKALFVKELNKMYDSNALEDDMVERAEEMERMRETVFAQIDTNKDGFIDYIEFLAQTKRQDYQEDHGWKSVDENRPYTNDELEAYIREQQQRLHPPPPGYYPPPPGAYNPNVPPGGYHPPPPNYQGYPPNSPPYQGGQGQYYPNQGGPPPVPPNQAQPNYQQQPQGQVNSQQPPPNYQGQNQPPQQGQVNQQQPNFQQQPQANQQQPNYQQQPQANQQQQPQEQVNQQQLPPQTQAPQQQQPLPPQPQGQQSQGQPQVHRL